MSARSCLCRAVRIAKKRPSTGTICSTCDGTGKQPITFITLTRKTEEVIGCMSCNGKGTMTETQKYEKMVADSVWCRCGNPSDMASPADDGYKVFGNDTYLCDDCGMVVQFG